MVKYCSKEYQFPKKAFIAIIWFSDNENEKLMAAISSQIHKNKQQVDSYVLGMESVLTKKSKTEAEIEAVDVYEIELVKLIDNKEEYWTKIPSKEKIDEGFLSDKGGWLSPFLKSPLLYDLLVVPRTAVGDEMVFDLAKVFLKGENSMKRIEDFMFYSDQVVEPTAKHSGIYEIKELTVTDWKSGAKKKGVLNKIDEDELMD